MTDWDEDDYDLYPDKPSACIEWSEKRVRLPRALRRLLRRAEVVIPTGWVVLYYPFGTGIAVVRRYRRPTYNAALAKLEALLDNEPVEPSKDELTP